jgi:multiple sugar transport system substrate-binding protein
VIWPNLQKGILGEMEPQAALDDAAEKARVIMEDAGYIK